MRCDHPLTDRRAMETEDIDRHLPTNTTDADAAAENYLASGRSGPIVEQYDGDETMIDHRAIHLPYRTVAPAANRTKLEQ